MTKLTSVTRSASWQIAAIAALLMIAANALAADKKQRSVKVPDRYLKQDDPLYQAITVRLVNDVKESVRKSSPSSAEGKISAAKQAAWPRATQEKFETLAMKSLDAYADQAGIDLSTFLLVIGTVAEQDAKKISAEFDLRVRVLAGGKYVAEFWEDHLAKNSEAHAIAWAAELAASPRAKKYPNENLDDVETIKQAYAERRRLIEKGREPRYIKLLGFVYSATAAGLVTFPDPAQPMNAFIDAN